MMDTLTDMDYSQFLHDKRITVKPAGFDPKRSINEKLFDFQRDIVRWGLRKGKCAFFEDCGLGKTVQQIEWDYHVFNKTGRPVLIFAPLAVSQQTHREGDKFGIPVKVCREQSDAVLGVNITNYEMLEHFDPREFGGIVIDESSILKGDGPMRKAITEFASHIPYRLACNQQITDSAAMYHGDSCEETPATRCSANQPAKTATSGISARCSSR